MILDHDVSATLEDGGDAILDDQGRVVVYFGPHFYEHPNIAEYATVRVQAAGCIARALRSIGPVEMGLRETFLLRTYPYERYLQTAHWSRVRQAALMRAGHRCELCNGKAGLEVHHRTYERLGCEAAADLITLCSDCHGRVHDKLPTLAATR